MAEDELLKGGEGGDDCIHGFSVFWGVFWPQRLRPKYTGVIAQLSLSQPSAASPSLPPPLK